jgi:tetratricopeptide (TPR) repeat protein
MKPTELTWRGYLDFGVRLMEGTEEALPWRGKRWFPEANAIFEDCAQQTEDSLVRVQGSYRRAQSAYYTGEHGAAKEWLRTAHRIGGPKSEFDAQLLLVEGILYVGTRDYRLAQTTLERAWMLAEDHKLRGDIANRLGRLYAEHGTRVPEWNTVRSEPSDTAADWFLRAAEQFKAVPEPDANTYHARAATCGRGAVLAQRRLGYRHPFARRLFREVEELLATKVHDPCVHATYWRNRSAAALRATHPLAALSFFLRSLLPGIACWRQKRRR